MTARLLELGMTVLKPVGDNCRYDLVIQDPVDGRFERVQCKTAHPHRTGSAVMVFAVSSSACHAGKGRRDYRGDVDLFGVWYPPTRTVYLVPVEEVGVSGASLRLEAARNGQTRGIRYAAQYAL